MPKKKRGRTRFCHPPSNSLGTSGPFGRRSAAGRPRTHRPHWHCRHPFPLGPSVTADRLAEVALDHLSLAHLQNLADPGLRLTEGSLVPARRLDLRVVTTPDPSPGHICLVYEPHGLIFSGDHVLPRTSSAHSAGAARVVKPAGGLLRFPGPDRARGRDGGLPCARVPVPRHAAAGGTVSRAQLRRLRRGPPGAGRAPARNGICRQLMNRKMFKSKIHRAAVRRRLRPEAVSIQAL